eukprot:TRINITY_DN20446_c0_g2_i2.p1 TRINITY_DN20446_c0_g2~~TRINITY_DN20446_c0_g2_i2.p1  ORF type:complete len:250 (-),score=51.08 TRINITY_DN20446_c0_g2_i2:289-1038(-)
MRSHGEERLHQELTRFNSVVHEFHKTSPSKSKKTSAKSKSKVVEMSPIKETCSIPQALLSRNESTTKDKTPVLEWSSLGEIAASSGERYLSCLRDLQPSDLPALQKLDSDIDSHLREVYGFSPEQIRRVEKYVHWPSSSHYCTLHVHIKFGEIRTAEEIQEDDGNDQRHFELSDVMDSLERGDTGFGIEYPFMFQSDGKQVTSWPCSDVDECDDDWWHQSGAKLFGPFDLKQAGDQIRRIRAELSSYGM